MVAEAEAAQAIVPLREQEAAKGAVLHRFKVAQETLEREAERTAVRQRELASRVEQLGRDLAREDSLIAEAKEAMSRLDGEAQSLVNTTRLASDFEQQALAAYDAAGAALKVAEARLTERTTAAADARARRQSLEAQKAERQREVAKLERQLIALDAQTREIIGRAPDASKLQIGRGNRPALDGADRRHRGADIGRGRRRAGRGAEAKASSEAAADLALVCRVSSRPKWIPWPSS